MRYTRKQGMMVTAIEWTGTNLIDVQRFMEPSSPLVRPEKDGSLSMMIEIFSAKYSYTDHELSRVGVGSYIVKDPLHPHFSLYTAAVFAQQFEAPAMETAEPEGLVTHVEPGSHQLVNEGD